MSSNTAEVYTNFTSNFNWGANVNISVDESEQNYFIVTTHDHNITISMNDQKRSIPWHMWEAMEAARAQRVEAERPDLFTPRPFAKTTPTGSPSSTQLDRHMPCRDSIMKRGFEDIDTSLANTIEVTAENVNLEDWPESPMSPSLFSPSWSRRPLENITNSFNRQDHN